jgi:hypothetical protein
MLRYFELLERKPEIPIDDTGTRTPPTRRAQPLLAGGAVPR